MNFIKSCLQNPDQFKRYFFTVLSGQIIYAAFEGFKGSFYNLMLQELHVTNTQLGLLFTLIGSAMFFYVPAGWINNRYSVKWLLFWGLGYRFITLLCMVLLHPCFLILACIAFSWGILDAIFWPACINGVALLIGNKNHGSAFGILESIHRGTEAAMNAIVLLAMSFFSSMVLVFHWAMLAYTLIILPMMWLVYLYAPNNAPKIQHNISKNRHAWDGLLKTLKTPSIWFAGLTALTIYWNYINLIYTVPYLQAVFHISQEQASIFGILNTSAMGILSGIISGFLADTLFKSSTKMMFIALIMTSCILLATILLPHTKNMLYIEILLLCGFSFSSFLAKSVILAPIAELNLPESISGSAMSVGSFLGYASIFWAYTLNGWLIDHKSAIHAYQSILTIGFLNSALGAIFAFLLLMSIRKHKSNDLI